MSTQIEHLENHTARLTVDVPPERVDKAMHEAARRIARQVNIPGFRKGKAPYNVVLQRFGEKTVLSEALESLGNEVFREALEETKLEPYAPGNLENVETEPTMKLTFVVPKQPEVDLGNYRDIRIPFETPEVEDSDVTKATKALQERRAVVEPANRPAQIGDLVRVFVHGERIHPPEEHITEEGSAAEEAGEGHEEQHEHKDTFMDEELSVVLNDAEDEESIVPGFSTNLVGMSAGEKKSFSLSFPADYRDEALAKHIFNFDVEVKEVQSRTLPALNDAFAKQVTNNEIDNLLDLRIRVRKDLQEQATRDAEAQYSEDVLDKVVEQAAVKYPEEMADEYVDDILQSIDRNLRERGLSLEHYKRIENKDDAALRAEYHDTAIERLKRALVLGELVRREQLDVSDADVDSQIDKMSAQFGEQADVFRKMLARVENKRNIAVDLITNRAFRRLMDIARGENPPIGVAAEETAPAEATPESAESSQRTETPAEGSPEASVEAPETTSPTSEGSSEEKPAAQAE